jgi:hypothetical protein
MCLHRSRKRIPAVMDFPSHHQAYKKKKNKYEGEDSFFFKKIIGKWIPI